MLIIKLIMLEPVSPFITLVASTPELEQRKDICKPSQISRQWHFSSFSKHHPAHLLRCLLLMRTSCI